MKIIFVARLMRFKGFLDLGNVQTLYVVPLGISYIGCVVGIDSSYIVILVVFFDLHILGAFH